jgi:hypothetical protein
MGAVLLFVVNFSVVFGGNFRGNVPTTIVTGGSFIVTTVAVKRPAVEKLLETFAVFLA